MCLKLELLFHNHPWPSPFSFIIHVYCTSLIIFQLAMEPFPFFSVHCWSSLCWREGLYNKNISTNWFQLVHLHCFFLSGPLYACLYWVISCLPKWVDRGFVEGMSAHPQDLAAPHMDRVQLVMSWYTDGPGGGTEWYRVVQSGTEWYSSRWWVVVIRWDPTTSPHYCQQELSNKLWTSPYLRLKRVSMILLWYP